MSRPPRSARRWPVAGAILVSVVGALVWNSEPAWTDDTDLLRLSTAKPYLFIMLDTSASMALKIGPAQDPPPGGGYGDDPESRLYQAKSALYSVFRGANESFEFGIHFGLASYNQDGLEVVNKHWLYYLEQNPPWFNTLPYPQADPDGLTRPEILGGEATGAYVGDVEGDSLSFGPRLNSSSSDVMGSCSAPLPLGAVLSRPRLKVNAFPKPADTTTVLWLSHGNPVRTYRVEMRPLQPLGDATLQVQFDVEQVITCSPFTATNIGGTPTLDMRSDPGLSEFFMVDLGRLGNQNTEDSAGLWDHRDVVSDTIWTCSGTCHPFGGKGWEGNYDGGDCGSIPAAQCTSSSVSNIDPYNQSCNPLLPAACNLKWDPTQANIFGPALDRGDVLPFDWDDNNEESFLARLSPDPWPNPNFGAAHYFDHSPTLPGWAPRWQLVSPATTDQPVLLAEGESPLAKVINDFRCWYLGQSGSSGKCDASAYFNRGYSEIACTNDDAWACRKIFFILITDGEETVKTQNEDPTGDISDLKSNGVRTWALNLGDPKECNSGGNLHPIIQTQQKEGRCIPVANKTQLLDTLNEIKVQIISASRAFAAAAVPSVQVDVSQSIDVMTLRATPQSQADDGSPAPRPGEDSVWDGHLLSFLKDLPTDDEGKPDTTRQCTLTDPKGAVRRACFLWDSGQRMLDQIGTPGNFLGAAADRRRVFYSRLVDSATGQPLAGVLGPGRRLFNATADGTDAQVRYDLWRGLGVVFSADNPMASPAVDQTAQDLANTAINKTFSLKHHEFFEGEQTSTKTEIDNILGDIFHSNPLVVGDPQNTVAYAANTGTHLNSPGAECGNAANPDRGYRCFADTHKNRRRLLLAGANDGMLHAFDIGVFRASGPFQGLVDDGTGKEAWAYIPREVLRTVNVISKTTKHQWGVDGPPAGADMLIDPLHDGTPDLTEREWRTVVVGGLREGGRSYYALDVTQPDRYVDDAAYGKVPVPLDGTDANQDYVPSCLGDLVSNAPSASCGGEVPYPWALWEFHDAAYENGRPVLVDADGDRPGESDFDPQKSVRIVRLDEDGNGEWDLGETWSVPALGRIRIGDGSGNPIDKYVAIFGGGMPPNNSLRTPDAGHWLYMVDVETGLAFYKRRLRNPATGEDTAMPADAAAVDTDQDGYLDRIYLATLGGLVFRVDLDANADGLYPQLETVQAPADDGITYDTQRVVRVFGGNQLAWEPYAVFDANFNDTTAELSPRALHYRPTVLFVASHGLYGLAFGGGDRQNLWSRDLEDPAAETPVERRGRFYLFVDDTDGPSDPMLPYTEGNFTRVDVAATDLASTTNLLGGIDGHRGWYLTLDGEERLISPAFAVSGITEFTTYTPVRDESGNLCGGDDGPGGGGGGGGGGEETLFCGRQGDSKIYVVFTTNANSVLINPGNNNATRFLTLARKFSTEPFVEQGQNKNPRGTEPPAPQLDAAQLAVMEKLKQLFPSNCKFANYRLDIKAITGETGVILVAPVPICIVEKNWKEF
jgi:hypothetical protein